MFFEPAVGKNKLLQALFKAVVSRVDAVSPYSPLMLKGLARIGIRPRRVVIMPNAIDVEKFHFKPIQG